MEPFVGQISIFAGSFAPRNWAFCNGQILPIQSYTALFSLIGTTYGGNGTSNFALPNLQGRLPLGVGNDPGLTPRSWGETGGQAQVTLSTSEMPVHTHPLAVQVSAQAGTQAIPRNANSVLAPSAQRDLRFIDSNDAGAVVTMNSGQTAITGGGQPHENRQPFLCLQFIIALQGIFPQRN